MNTYREAVEDARMYGYSPTYQVGNTKFTVAEFWKHKLSADEGNDGRFISLYTSDNPLRTKHIHLGGVR
jgi:hypothetical protein